ncbi:hypothetical protein GW17_00037253, partial [Ensete ventricosum]
APPPPPGAPSPRTLRSTRSSVSSTVAKVTPAAALKCVCAPTTHAGSFKCRLHRVSSHGRSTASFIACPKHQPPTYVSSTPLLLESYLLPLPCETSSVQQPEKCNEKSLLQ